MSVGLCEAPQVRARLEAFESAIRKFVHQNPAMIGQKAAIIVEHFRAHTARALGGRAKRS